MTGIREKYRKETLKFHERSRKHIKCVEHERVLESQQTSQIVLSVKKVDEKNSPVYEKLFNTAYYVATEGEPMTNSKSYAVCKRKMELKLIKTIEIIMPVKISPAALQKH